MRPGSTRRKVSQRATVTGMSKTPATDCPRCPDGHTPFQGGSHPWNVRVDNDVVRGDGAPTRLIVERSAGEHCAEADADDLYEMINPRPAKAATRATDFAGQVRLGAALIAMLTFAMALLGGAALIGLAIDADAGALAYLSALALVVIVGLVVNAVMAASLGSPAPAEPAQRGA